MRFEPKIIRPSEPPELAAAEHLTDEEFESRLPGELEFLAAQLRDDAAHLASVYPAGSEADESVGISAAPVESVRPSRRRTWLAWSAAGSLASVVLVAAVALPWVLPKGEGRSPNLVDSKVPASPAVAPVDHREPDLGRLVQAVVDKTDVRDPASSSATPAMFLQNVSGPELEGLFDLWEEDPAEQGRISI